MNPNESALEDLVEGMYSMEMDAKKRSVLAMLLDDVLRREGFVLAQRTQMGGTEAYLASVTFNWLANNVGLARNLPLFKKFRPEDDRGTGGPLIVDAESVELFMQRDIKWSRQQELAEYLINFRSHKFPPILAVITAPWVDDPQSDAWGADGRAVRGVADFSALDGRRHMGLLNVSDEYFTVFALDGQHRLIGVQGALDLIRKDRLPILKDDGTASNEVITLDQLLEESHLSHQEVMKLPSETIGIEFIPAVIAGETRDEAKRRVRSIFTHVNKQAAPLTKGEIAVLDEDDGFVIVARKVAVQHPILGARREERVNMKNSTIAQRSAALTTLQSLKEMSTRYLGQMEDYQPWKAKGRLLPVRPSDEELQHGIAEFSELWDKIAELPSIADIERGKSTADMRRFAHETPPGEGHMLFRPIGQIALAEAVGALRANGVSLDKIFEKLAILDQRGGFRLDDPANVWLGVLYDPAGQRMRIAGRDTAKDLLRYLVMGIADDAARDELTERLRDARRVDEAQDQYRGFDGSLVGRAQIHLPGML